MRMTYEEWLEKYQPLKNPLNENASYDGYMFDTHGKDVDYIRNGFIANCFLWTIVDCENEEQYIIPGWHIVNRAGYFVTYEPWIDEEIEVNLNEMITVGEAKYACIEFLESLGIPEEQYEDLIHDFFNQKF